MHTDVIMGDLYLKGEDIEQMVNHIFKILAQYKLSYDESLHVLNTSKEELGKFCLIKV